MPRKRKSTAIATTGSAVRDVIHPMVGSGEPIRVDAVFHVRAVHPNTPGPWSDEADKIAWTDPMTGLGCIIRRSPRGGHLCGYVSVPPGHPLYGRRVGSLGDELIGVHGGLDYAAVCQHWEAEEVSICHPGHMEIRRLAPGGFQQKVHANEAADRDDDAWWFGFSCDHAGDVVPMRRANPERERLMAGVNEVSYKDEAFVHRECTRLAVQLKAIGDGLDPRTVDPGPSVAAYDPRRIGE